MSLFWLNVKVNLLAFQSWLHFSRPTILQKKTYKRAILDYEEQWFGFDTSLESHFISIPDGTFNYEINLMKFTTYESNSHHS